MDMKKVIERLKEISNHGIQTAELDEYIAELEKELEAETITDEQWDSVMENARFMLIEYKKIPNGMFGAINIANAINRYENGERTKELYEELESIQ